MTSPVMSSGVAAGRPQPQTTVEPAGGPFIRHSQPGRRAMYVNSGTAFGGLIANPLVAAPGYTRKYRIKVQGTGGNGTTVTGGVDAPGNIASLVQMKDSFGTPLIIAPGYEAFQLIPLFGGQFGAFDNSNNPLNLPSFSGIATTSGNFTVNFALPLEFAKAYGVISSANASLLPTLQINVNTAAAFYGTSVPGTLPTLAFTVDQDFYWLPEGVSVEPPGLGTTQQWIYQPANPTIGSAASLNVQLPRLGGYLSVIIAELRDSTGARTTVADSDANGGWPARLRFLVDGVPLLDSDITTLYDDIAIETGVGAGYGGAVQTNPTAMNARPVGVVAINRKQSLSQRGLGLFDTGEIYLSTNPGTQVEFAGAPWGAIGNAPATLNALCGQVVPSGTLIQGLPEV